MEGSIYLKHIYGGLYLLKVYLVLLKSNIYLYGMIWRARSIYNIYT